MYFIPPSLSNTLYTTMASKLLQINLNYDQKKKKGKEKVQQRIVERKNYI